MPGPCTSFRLFSIEAAFSFVVIKKSILIHFDGNRLGSLPEILMTRMDDFSDAITEEILTETANDFLGKRKKVENQIEVLQTTIRTLEEKSRRISKIISLLNYILIKEPYISEFYITIGAPRIPQWSLEGHPHFDLFKKKLPFSIRPKKTCIRLISEAYRLLQESIDDYMGADDNAHPAGKSGISANTVTYPMVVAMIGIINENIARVNHDRSPSSVLQFARSLNTQMAQKEKITGAVSGDYEARLDSKLRLESVHLPDTLIKYACLPKAEKVGPEIASFGRRLYHETKHPVQSILAELKIHQKAGPGGV